MTTLFTPYTLRDITFKNRIAVSPMSQYRAKDGYANDWHLVHLGRFAMGGAAIVYAEATAIEPDAAVHTGIWVSGKMVRLKS